MTDKPKASGALDPEMLAAYIDKRLPPDERAVVEAQLATDPDSYELLVELIHANEALKDAAPADDTAEATEGRPEEQATVVPLVPKPARTRTWAIAGGVLAVAAALVLVVRLQPDLLQRLRGGDAVDPQLAKLVAAVGEERYIEARLTGGFKYGPLRSVARGSGDLSRQNLELLAAAGELQKKAQQDSSVESLHAWAIARVLLGDYDGAIQTLSELVDEPSVSAKVKSDLGAAYLARATTANRLEDLPKALEFSEAASTQDPASDESVFNTALALEAMNLQTGARAAWEEFLKRHGTDDEWAAFARQRLSRLTEKSGRAPAQSAPPSLEKWLTDDGSQVSAAIGAGELARLDGLLQRLDLVRLGDHIEPLAGDFQVWLRADAAANPVRASRLVRRLADAVAASVQNRPTEAAQLLEETDTPELRRTPPYFVWARLYLSAAYLSGRFDDVLRIVEREAPYARQRNYHRLYIQMLGFEGAVYFARGDYSAARNTHAEAANACARVDDRSGAAAARILLAETHRVLGDGDLAWQEYVQALRDRELLIEDNRRYAVLVSPAIGALNEGAPAVAAHLATEALAFGNETGVAVYQTESGYLLAKAQDELGDRAAALDSLRNAEVALNKVSDAGLRRRLSGDYHLMAARIRMRDDPDQALRDAELALQEFRALTTQHREIRILSVKSDAARLLGRGADAEQSLEQAVATISDQLERMDGPFVRASFVDDVWEPVSKLVELEVASGQPDRALETFRRGMSIVSVPRDETGDAVVPARRLIVTYASTPTELYVWTEAAGTGVEFHRVSVTRSELIRRVRRLRRAIEGDRAPEMERSARDLAAVLVWPIAPGLIGRDEMLVLADPLLQRVPFGLLPVGSENSGRLIERVAIALCDSVSSCAAPNGQSPAGPASALFASVADGGPGAVRLPAAESEATSVAKLYPAGAAREATPAAMRQALAAAGVVHFSGHAYLNAERPWLSSLGLSERGVEVRVVLRDALPARIHARVVILSACTTLGADPLRGQGVVGMTSEFTRRGAAAAVGTLWDVDDRAAGTLMPRIHEGLARGVPVWEAVRQAQLTSIRAGDSPRAWAAAMAVSGSKRGGQG